MMLCQKARKEVPEFRNIKIKIFKTYIGLLKYANYWNIPLILINSSLKISKIHNIYVLFSNYTKYFFMSYFGYI